MDPFYEREGIRIYVGDNREVLPHIEPVHAVVTDPPYGLSFMGKGWDHQVPGVEFWQAISGAMLPGAHLLAFGGTCTYHRMAVAIEDAGYEIRDTLQWLYGSGFPKSHDVSKAIDATIQHGGSNSRRMKAANESRPGEGRAGASLPNNGVMSGDRRVNVTRDEPATPEAHQWQGWGTALKPAYEPIIMARLPFKDTVAANVLGHGTGALNVDACRIAAPGEGGASRNHKGAVYEGVAEGYKRPNKSSYTHKTDWQMQPAGRWPANVILDEAAAEALDAQSGVRKSGKYAERTTPANRAGTYSGFDMCDGKVNAPNNYGDTGGASRFFYVAKASRRERNAGLEGMPERVSGGMAGTADLTLRTGSGNVRNNLAQNHHPTVKPIALMRYLIQMVTPPGGVLLDPFMGSGSTLVAAAQLGFQAIGIELSEEYAEIAARRVDHALNERDPQLALEGIA